MTTVWGIVWKGDRIIKWYSKIIDRTNLQAEEDTNQGTLLHTMDIVKIMKIWAWILALQSTPWMRII